MGDLYEFDDVDTFTAGAIGEPGHRTFYLQVRSDGQRVTLKCEKQQVDALTQYLHRLLNDLPTPTERPIPQSLDLVRPEDAVAFVVGPMGLSYDRDLDRFVLLIEETVPVDAETGEPDPDDVEDRGRMRMRITRGQALAFAEHGEEIVAAGRPSCVWCGLPMDPDGHGCPRMN
jgi:uncharacterized repeat protein (TIGR03847 family)